MTRTAEQVLAAYKPATKTVRLLLDGGLQAEIDSLREQVKAAERRDKREGESLDSKTPELRRQLDELEARADSEAEAFCFQAVPRAKFDALKAAHPPTEEQWQLHREAAKTNPFLRPPECDYMGIGPELISLSCVDPELSVEEAQQLWDLLAPGPAAQLWEAAWEVSNGSSIRPTFGTGIDTTPSSGPDSTTPLNGESPSPPSTDEP